MKRNSITKKIISLVLSVLMLSSCWVFAPIEAEAATEVRAYELKYPRPGENRVGFGLVGGTCVNNKTFYDNESNWLICIDTAHKKLAYCIEIGTPVNSNRDLNLKDELDACEILRKRLETTANAALVSMSAHDMQRLLRSVLGFGYQHDGSDMTTWTNITTNTINQDRFCKAYATQMLIWELVSGERDKNFNKIAPPNSSYKTIYDHCIKSTNPLKDRIKYFYSEIESNVKNTTPTLDPAIPADKTFTFKTDDVNKVMTVSIPDSTGLFRNTDLISIKSADGSVLKGVKKEHINNHLTITVPYRYAKEGTYKLEYTIINQVPRQVEIYISGDEDSKQAQDMLYATGGIDIQSENGYLTLILPHHHEWVPHVINPTCTTEGLTCMMCKCGDIYTKEEVTPLDHNYTDSAWVVGQQATCTEDGELIQICERCNTVIDSKPIPKTGHNGVWIIETEPTADHDGQMILYCTKCGNRTETKSYESHNHEFGYNAIVRDATCTSEGLKGKFCKLCGVCYDTSTIPAGHSESLVWVTTLHPTCTSEGERSAFCSDCGDIVTTKSVESTGHSEGTWITSIAPYCGLSGEEVCYCDKCGEITDSREIEALSHDEGVWKIKNDPTCELDGEKVKSCTRCGHIIETEAIEALGHDDGVWKIDIEATADLDGSMNRYCTRCSMVLETKTFTLHTHEEGYKATLLQPTCTRDGEKGTVCGICNAVYATEEVDSLGHDYSEFYTEANGTHSKSCSRCHYVYTENCGYETIESVEATCTTAGYKTHKCTVCAYTYSNSFVPPYGHTLGKWSSEGKSTHMRYCTDCGVMEISKHVWGEYFSNNDGDFIEEGSKTRSCIYCGESQTIGKPASIIKSAYKATMNLLDFLIKLFGALSVFAEELANFLEKV